MINYNLPGFYDHFLLNKFFIELYNKNPEVFLPGVKISSVYGNFPFTSWDGGRCFNHYKQLLFLSYAQYSFKIYFYKSRT